MIDLLIRGGAVYDGTGAEPFEADIGVAGDKIAFINKVSGVRCQVSKTRGEKVIDAKGIAVSPGFIDTHAHSEFTLLADPRAEGKLFQGITTEINGNCGLSAAPIYNEAEEHRENDIKELKIKERWKTFGEYCRILEDRGIYTSHMRSEGRGLIESIKEIIRIEKEANIKVHISHIKTSGKENWDKIDEAAGLIEDARMKGIQVTCDTYPYTASNTDLDTILPSWTYDGGTEEELMRLKNPEMREKIKKQILHEHTEKDYWKRVSVSSVSSQKNKWMEGKTLSYISRKINKSPVDALFKILIEEKLRAGAIFSSMSEDNLERFLFLPYVMLGSDSSARSRSGLTCKGKPHPRGFGSFPRFLGRYVRDKGLMSTAEGIRKITMFPAKTFGIKGRGVLNKGAFADIVVFDPERIIDRATFMTAGKIV